jgi:hypothetical protein
MRSAAIWLMAVAFAAQAGATTLGSPGGPEPANLEELTQTLAQQPYDLELLISYGTSKGGSAGHLALAIRDPARGEELVHSANFYADRSREHAQGRYTDDLMIRVPKREYLYGTTSSLGEAAAFGLDFGEVYKRSVIGIRVSGVPEAEKAALTAFFERINADYRSRAKNTVYHDGEVKYDYLRLNCAKTIGSAFKHGAGYDALDVTSPRALSRRRVVAAANANIPTEMAMKLMEEWAARGYGIEVVLYRKFEGSTYVDPREDEKIAFRDLPDRFPSVLSRDFRKDQGEYEDYDNLYAMYLLRNLMRSALRLDPASQRIEIELRAEPLPYPEAAERAAASARADSEGFLRRAPFRRDGTSIDGASGRPAP